MALVDADSLERSWVVANCRMNRERTLTGSNGYAGDLGFNPLAVLEAKSREREQVSWLDLCCGSGRALVEAAGIVHRHGWENKLKIVGVDLVKTLMPPDPASNFLQFVQASLSTWKSDQQFDLITCVHGWHYIGDKLGLISRAVSWLKEDGLFAANLDLNNCKFVDGRLAGRIIGIEFRRNGLRYDRRKKLLTCEGRREVKFDLRFVGADDEAGPNYTCQPAVDSYYQSVRRHA
jgi:SAM-dependent methyltransferase